MEMEVTPLVWDKGCRPICCSSGHPEESAILLAELPQNQGQELTQLPSLTELPTGGCEDTSAPGLLTARSWAWVPLCIKAEKALWRRT